MRPFPRPLCTKPSLLVNRNAVSLWLNNGVLHTPRGLKLCPYVDIFHFDWKHWVHFGYRLATCNCVGPQRGFIQLGDGTTIPKGRRGFEYLFDDASILRLQQYYVTFADRVEYLFQLVPCGHCELCHERRVNDFANRCSWESQTSENRALFVTLTYDNKHIPMDEDGKLRGCKTHERYKASLCKRDIQLFLKRLRTNWERRDFSLLDHSLKLRYVCVGEYGSKSGHPHYHFIFWNYPYHITNDAQQVLVNLVRKDIFSAWGNGEYQSQKVEIARDCARYVAKYVNKSNKNGRDGFITTSRRGGGIGAKFLDLKKSFHSAHPQLQFISFMDKWSGQLQQHTMGAYATNRLFPPLRHYLSIAGYRHYFESLCARAMTRCMEYHRWIYDHHDAPLPVIANLKKRISSWQDVLDHYRILPFELKWTNIVPQLPLDVDVYKVLDTPKDYHPYWLPYLDKHSHCLYGLTDQQLLNRVKRSFGQLDESAIAEALRVRDVHLSAVSPNAMSDAYVYQKHIDTLEKQMVRQEREVF